MMDLNRRGANVEFEILKVTRWINAKKTADLSYFQNDFYSISSRAILGSEIYLLDQYVPGMGESTV